MASIKSSFCVVALLVACDVIRGAPVLPSENEVKDGGVNNKVADVGAQERDIQDLMNLVKSQTKDRPVSVQRQVQTHVENINGQVTQVQEKEEKVIDTAKDKVVSDVKQTIQQLPSGDDGKPKVQVETKVDIPSAGVHETLANQEAAEDTSSESEASPEAQAAAEAVLDSDVDAMRQEVDANANEAEEDRVEMEQEELTPADMAAFLYETQQLDAFYPALRKLVNESKMTPDEAEAYAEEVVLQYQRLQLRDIEMSAFAAEKREAMPLDLYGQPPLPVDASVGMDDFAPQPMEAYGYSEGYPSPQEQYMIQLQMQQQQQQQQQQEPAQQYLYNSDLGFDPLDFLTVLYEAAYGKDNAEAREILRLLYDRVSRDDNPDDLDQIRDLLIETVANSLGDDGQDRPIPWDIPPPMIQSLPVDMPEFEVGNQGAFVESPFMPPVAATTGEESLNEDNVEEESNNNAEDTAHNEGEEEEDLEAQLSNMNQQKTKRDDETANPVADNNEESSNSSSKDDNSSDNGDAKNASDDKGEE